ncbi:MAG: bifunctional hydroxymethylpyrimidine kinase/phosphomethylpyrimidine kinase [Pirellulales bacterium]|nr:bifunctional hydroxymethylpyrimidine kinase/phosphomethylpyrimidine kinase [Pirellulales bacterium]
MIVSAGLSPAWQQILRFERFRLGEVNRAAATHWCASGKSINVGIGLHHLCGGRTDQSLTVSTLGGPAFEAFEREFADLGVPRRWIRTQSPTRICTTILDESTGTSTELVENVGPITEGELAQFEAAFAESVESADAVVLTGSLPRRAPTNLYRRLLEHVSCHAVVDARGPELLAAIEARPLVVKPNREELAKTLDCEIRSDDDLRCAMAQLQRRGAQWVVVSSGNGDIWIAAAGDYYRAVPLVVEQVVNPIGCGDCFAAGIAWGLAHGHEPMTAIRYGIAAAAENLETLLPARLDPKRVVERSAKVAID